MRCPICNADTEAFGDCVECQSVIQETILGYENLGEDDDEVVLDEDA